MRQLACWLAQQADISRFKSHSICSEIPISARIPLEIGGSLRLLLGAKQDIAERVLVLLARVLQIIGAGGLLAHKAISMAAILWL